MLITGPVGERDTGDEMEGLMQRARATEQKARERIMETNFRGRECPQEERILRDKRPTLVYV